MYLSLLLIDVGNNPDRPRPGRLWLRNVYHVHQRLCMAFPTDQQRACDPGFLRPYAPDGFAPSRFLFRIDHAVLFSGDGDFRPLVESLQRQGVRVSVVSTIRSQPPMIADELRRQADNFIELDELREVIGRPPREPRPVVAEEIAVEAK